MRGDRIITALRTPAATLVVLIAALLAQLPHAADVFRLVVHGDGLLHMLHGYSYAVALELAVLLFVVQRRNAESYAFALVSVCVNLAYYALHGVDLFSVAALPAWLISVALPAAIARYSHLIVDAAHVADAPSATHHDAGATQSIASACIVHASDDAVHAPDDAESVADALHVADARAQALQMHAEGMSATQIARALQRNPSTVRAWLRRAAQEDAYGAR